MAIRARTLAWMGFAMGLSLAPMTAPAWAQVPADAVTTADSGVSRSSRVRSTVQGGIESYRKGDYERAAAYFQKAQAAEADLTNEDKQNLSAWLELNKTALQARREGNEQLRHVEQSIRNGRTQEALTTLRAIGSKQAYLTAVDNQKYQELSKQLTSSAAARQTVPGSALTASGTMARSKLKQARAMLTKGNYQAARALNAEAERLGSVYGPNEDSPEKVAADIDRAQAPKAGDAKELLAAARNAYNQGDLDRAEAYAHEAEKAGTVWGSLGRMWGDTPAKVLRDVKASRSKQGIVTQSTTSHVVSSDKTEAARQMLTNARQAIRSGDLAQAKVLAEEAKAQKPNLNWREDTPDKVLADIRKLESTGVSSNTTREVKPVAKSGDAKAMLKQARELYTAGKYDEAEKVAHEANAVRTGSWGLFEFDSPDKVLTDIRNARARQDKAQSGRVLADARKLYDQGNLEEAQKLAYKAKEMHGPYNLWDLGDRPSKLLAEIEIAKRKRPASVTKAADATAVAAKDATSTAGRPVMPPPAWPLKNEPQPSAIAKAPSVPELPVAAAASGSKSQATALLAEARQLQRENKLVEARQKALAAQKIGATFGPNEERPEQVLLALSALGKQRMESLVQRATDHAGSAEYNPTRLQMAEQDLGQARQIALAFGFDTQLVDSKMTWVQRVQGKATTEHQVTGLANTVQAPAPLTTASAGQTQGQELLNKARLELRAGQTGNARRLAESALEPRYGVQQEAAQILRSIDAEEFNQKLLLANRTFDAGLAAYSRQDYSKASTILRSIDPAHLTPEKQGQLKQILHSPSLAGTSVAQIDHKAPPDLVVPGTGQGQAAELTLPKGPTQHEDFTKQVLAMQEVKFQQLHDQSRQVQRQAMQQFKNGETDKAIESLQEFSAGLSTSGLDSDRVALIRRQIDTRLQSLRTLKHQRDFERLQANQVDAVNRTVVHERLAEQEKQTKVKELLKQYNALVKEGKYKDAELAALKARDIDPDNEYVGVSLYTVKMLAAQTKAAGLKNRKEQMTANVLDDAEEVGPSVTSGNPLVFDPKVAQENRTRKGVPDILQIEGVKSQKEREIYRKLDGPIASMDFKDTPLRQILDDIAQWTGLNIVPDAPALNEAGISLERPLTMKLEGIALKSALNVLLRQVHLTYVVRDEVLQITTEENAKGKTLTRIHPVLDLVIPVENASPQTNNILRQAAMGGGTDSNLKLPGVTPYEGRQGLTGGKDVSMNSLQNLMSSTGSGPGIQASTKENPKGTTEDVLIKLITNTISPQTWAGVGGPGTVEFWPLGMALVINQTPDIQEQVAELLQALRRLQDQEVAVEVRFITVAESFYERIGLDFNINIRNNQTRYEPQLVSQQFRPFGFINHFTPKNFISGLTPAGTFTQDLGIPLKNNSFNLAVPPFGSFQNAPGANGGLSLGMAFLSDIEVFLFMEAAQGDQRTNVMQAPKLTLFNGQTSTLFVSDQHFFTTSVTVAQLGGQVVFVPQNNLFPTGGVTLTIQAVISADRRFVRMSLVPILNSLASANVPLFPITTFITPIFEGGAVGQPIPFTQFLQQPTFNTITVSTTVNVPDGGTVLMGGLKRLSEGRNEFGTPILSKIPYINRLFKNVGYGREAESLMIMVTPRVIINEEEELKQVPGTLPAPGTPQ